MWKQTNKLQKAQTVLELSVLLACVAAALMAMQIYLKRSIEGRIKGHADAFGQQYSPEHTTGSFTVRRSASSHTVTVVQDLDDKTIVDTTSTIGSNGPDTDSSSGSLTVDSLRNETLF